MILAKWSREEDTNASKSLSSSPSATNSFAPRHGLLRVGAAVVGVPSRAVYLIKTKIIMS
jgi:hypothetical protein